MLARGQSDAPAGAAFHADSTLVLVPVTVVDPMNRYVLGLEKQNFHILEDNVEQKIAFFSGEDAPLSVGLLVDTSGSMGSKLDLSRQAVSQFLRTMNAADESFLIEFSDLAELSLPFTHDGNLVERKLLTATPGGLTALLDAVHMGLREMHNARNPRKALIVISDGGDNNSRYTATDIQSLVKESDVQIYAMGVFEPLVYLGMTAAEVSGPKLLSEIAEQTGGRTFATTHSSELPDIATRIGIELRNQYVLAYSPANQQKNGAYRKVQVKLDQPKELPALKARWRSGYYAPAQ
jgi:Ca-activated chloride channel homolog